EVLRLGAREEHLLLESLPRRLHVALRAQGGEALRSEVAAGRESVARRRFLVGARELAGVDRPARGIDPRPRREIDRVERRREPGPRRRRAAEHALARPVLDEDPAALDVLERVAARGRLLPP